MVLQKGIVYFNEGTKWFPTGALMQNMGVGWTSEPQSPEVTTKPVPERSRGSATFSIFDFEFSMYPDFKLFC